jgi:flagellar M-ring protein FliF
MDQITTLVKDLTFLQRVSIVAAVLIAGGTIAALLHYRHEGDFRPLYTSMAPEDAAPVVQKLKESGVEYRLSDGGSVVLVPSARLAESRLTLASAGLPKSGRIGFELFDKTNFGATELVEHINYQRALEGELERSVLSMAEVVQTRVHLTFPRESVFLDQQQPAKASVMVKLRPGARISAQNVLAVSNLVASAVEGLNTDAVAVIDMDGNLLSRPKRASTGTDSQITSEALEVRQQIEHDLVAKIGATIEPLLGADQFRAGASVECDLTSGDQQEETYNPDQSVMQTSQKTEDVNERASTAGGVPGTAANLPHPPASPGSGGGTSHKTENVTYQTSRIIRHTRIPQGVVRRMSLSVLVGQPVHWEGSGKNRHRVTVPPSPETMKTIRDLVAGVTGFNADRGDQLIVETLPFESSVVADSLQMAPATPTKADPQPAWLEAIAKYRNVLFMAVGGLVILAVLIRIFLGFMSHRGAGAAAIEVNDELETAAALRRAAALEKPVAPAPAESAVPSAPASRALGEAHAETAERIRQMAQRDPAVSANVLKMWLHNKEA